MPAIKVSVLVVDDDIRALRMMQRTLALEDYRVLTVSNGEAALGVFDRESPNLVLLDIMMPGMDGYNVCQRIREFSQVPIIMVTAKGSDEEKVKGLDAGTDDYISKPFSSQELLARVRAVLRRTRLRNGHTQPVFCYNELVIDFARRRVSLEGREVNLTATEYRVLSYLALNADRVLTPDQIMEKVWGENYIGETHLLQVNIARLRQKLGDDAKNARYIVTKPGIGYTILKQK